VRLWRLPDGQALATLCGHTDGVTCLAVSPDGRLLVSGSHDHTVRLWRVDTLEERPIAKVRNDDLAAARADLPDDASADGEREWLAFLKALLRWRRRFVEIGTLQPIAAGDFDIELD
jgi:WD40 repeat protein